MGGRANRHRARDVRRGRLRLRRVRPPARLSRRRRRRPAAAQARARARRHGGATSHGGRRAHRPRARRRCRRGDRRDGRITRTGGRRGRRHPLCAFRGAKLRAAAGRSWFRPGRARGEDECVRDDRDGTGARRARRDLRRAGTVRCLCRPRGCDLRRAAHRPQRPRRQGARRLIARCHNVADVARRGAASPAARAWRSRSAAAGTTWPGAPSPRAG